MSSAMSTARCGSHRPARDKLGKVFALDVLHRDVEVPFAIADVEDLGHAAALFALGELVLQDRATAFGGDYVDAVAIPARVNQLQADLPVQHGIIGEKNTAHAAAGQLADDLITAEEFGVHISLVTAFCLRSRRSAGWRLSSRGMSAEEIFFIIGRLICRGRESRRARRRC